MIWAVGSIFILAMLAPRIHRLGGRFSGWALSLLPWTLTFYFLSLIPAVASGNFPAQTLSWADELGVRLAFRLDGLGLLFSVLICGIGALILPYAAGYLCGDSKLGRFYLFFLMFMGSMLGLVLSDNLIVLFIFWELTSLSSYFLIGHYHDQEDSRRKALQALLVTGIGGLAMLAGFLLLAQIGGSMELSALMPRGTEIVAHPLFGVMMTLVLIGALTKSAQFPFHFWLPNAMTAPAPVSAYLHSSTMVKAGVYLIARCNPLFQLSPSWGLTLTIFGASTLAVGAWLSFRQTDLKKYLAYMTVSALGVMVMLLGMGSKVAIQAAMTFLLAHALYKGCLFMVAGAIDHATHCRNPEELNGLRGAMPWTAGIALLGALSMAGVLPSFGFIAKESLLESVLHAERGLILISLAVLGGAFFAAVAWWVAVKPFWGQANPAFAHAHESPLGMLWGPGVLALLGIGLGFFPSWGTPLLGAAAGSAMASPAAMKLALWHGVNPALILSLTALAGGAWLYWKRHVFLGFFARFDRGFAWGPEKIYESSFKSLQTFATFQTRLLQGGRLRIYFRITLIATAALAVTALLTRAEWFMGSVRTVHAFDALLGGLIFASTAAVILSRTRLTSVVAMGVIGLAISIIFVRFGAPDLAMTQFAVETLTVILLAFVLYRMPAQGAESSSRTKAVDAVIAAVLGTVMAILTFFSSVATPFLPAVAKYYSENSLLLAHGRNIVNVIIVDFRALDTLGEITVLAVAGIGVFTLLRLILASEEKAEAQK